MIIPVRCVTCGKVLADKWTAYERMCADIGEDPGDAKVTQEVPTSSETAQKSARGLILDKLGITRGCCRTVMLTHVDMSLII
jgi:DNA-directed RNA polymerase I, II, and III subunit RPABC5